MTRGKETLNQAVWKQLRLYLCTLYFLPPPLPLYGNPSWCLAPQQTWWATGKSAWEKQKLKGVMWLLHVHTQHLTCLVLTSQTNQSLQQILLAKNNQQSMLLTSACCTLVVEKHLGFPLSTFPHWPEELGCSFFSKWQALDFAAGNYLTSFSYRCLNVAIWTVQNAEVGQVGVRQWGRSCPVLVFFVHRWKFTSTFVISNTILPAVTKETYRKTFKLF